MDCPTKYSHTTSIGLRETTSKFGGYKDTGGIRKNVTSNRIFISVKNSTQKLTYVLQWQLPQDVKTTPIQDATKQEKCSDYRKSRKIRRIVKVRAVWGKNKEGLLNLNVFPYIWIYDCKELPSTRIRNSHITNVIQNGIREGGTSI